MCFSPGYQIGSPCTILGNRVHRLVRVVIDNKIRQESAYPLQTGVSSYPGVLTKRVAFDG